jgi:Protein of unknown function (DUF3137)
MINMPDVDTLMAGGLGHWLDQKAAERAKAREKVLWTSIAGVVLAAFLGLIGLFFGVPLQLLMFGAVVIGGGFFAWASHIRQSMVNSLKQEMNGALARALGVEFLVDPVSGPEFQLACEYDLLPSHDDDHFQDQWHGAVGGTDFLLYEAKLTEERGSGKSRRTVTVFRGVVLRFRFARDFIGSTLVRRDGFKFTLFGDSKSYGDQKLERIKMVDPRFEDAFDVYGSDQVEGRYLVHPAYCERLLELERDFFGEKLRALFHGGDLLVAIETDDMFESATLDPAQDRQRLAVTIDQFASIARLIQTLNERPRS